MPCFQLVVHTAGPENAQKFLVAENLMGDLSVDGEMGVRIMAV
jgi:hypothetical protein